MSSYRAYRTKISLLGAILVCMGVLFTSCQSDPNSPGVEYMPDMYRSPSFETYGENFNFADSMEARLPVVGTIPRGFSPYPIGNDSAGIAQAGSVQNPFESSEEIIKQGEILYTKFCLHCHGKEGGGDGAVVENGGHPPPPAYAGGNSSKYLKPMMELNDGEMFHTLTFGQNTMGAHASQITQTDRWKIIHYVKKLQGKVKEKTEDVEDEKIEVAEDTPVEAEPETEEVVNQTNP